MVGGRGSVERKNTVNAASGGRVAAMPPPDSTIPLHLTSGDLQSTTYSLARSGDVYLRVLAIDNEGLGLVTKQIRCMYSACAERNGTELNGSHVGAVKVAQKHMAAARKASTTGRRRTTYVTCT